MKWCPNNSSTHLVSYVFITFNLFYLKFTYSMYSLYFSWQCFKNLLFVFRVKHEKGYAICGLAWHPTCGRIAYTDAEGNLGLLENVCNPNRKTPSSKVISNIVERFLPSLSLVIWISKAPQPTLLSWKIKIYVTLFSNDPIVKKIG